MLKDHNAVTPVRLEPVALRSRVKHSTTEPLRSLKKMLVFKAEIHELLVIIANREDPDQAAFSEAV